ADLQREFSRHSLDIALRNCVITRILPGFYAESARAEDWAVRAEALSRWCPEIRVSGKSALTLMGVVLPAPDCIAAITPHQEKPRMAEWSHVRRLALPSVGVWARAVRCVPPPRAVVDGWHRAGRPEDEEVVYRCLWDRVASATEVL